MSKIVRTIAAGAALGVLSQMCAAAGETKGLSFRYEDGKPAEITIGRYVGGPPGTKVSKSTPIKCQARTQEKSLSPVTGEVYAYASFLMRESNPAPFVDGQPTGYQTVTLGGKVDGKFVEAVRFGIVDDDRASPEEKANYVPGAYDGSIEYYGMYCRPRTPYDFKLKLDLNKKRMTAWVSGRGDDEWFPLLVEAPLMNPVGAIDAIRVDQLPDAPGIRNLVVRSTPWQVGENVRSHPLAKKDRVVGPGKGFNFQSMRSLWRKADRHVTVARNPNASHGWWLGFPDVVQTDDGHLVCGYTLGPGHGGSGPTVVQRSRDLGKTWDERTVIYPGVSAIRLQKRPDGSLLMASPGFNKSVDGGHTWQGIGSLDFSSGGHCCVVPSRITEAPDGTWLWVNTYAPGKAFQMTDGVTLEVFRSTDRGKRWLLYSVIKPPHPLSISEASIVALPDDRLVLFARESSSCLPGIKTFSSDGGKTWGPPIELPFLVEGRTSAELLDDGRVMLTFRAGGAGNGPPTLWAWIGDADEKPVPLVHGVHVNDHYSVALKDDGLHIDSDGISGQFTKYVLRPPDGPDARIEIAAELKVVSNNGRAATLSVPFVGKLRFFPDNVHLAQDPSVRVSVKPGKFHTYRVVSENGKMTLFVDGEQALVTDKIDRTILPLAWSRLKLSPHALFFGNEECPDDKAAFDWVMQAEREEKEAAAEPGKEAGKTPSYRQKNITPAVTGHSIWRRVDVKLGNTPSQGHEMRWRAARGVFPDQYQLDHILEVEGSISGGDQGYSGWTQLKDGRILVVNYTDDTARWNCDASHPPLGVSWIRGIFVLPSDLAPVGGPEESGR